MRIIPFALIIVGIAYLLLMHQAGATSLDGARRAILEQSVVTEKPTVAQPTHMTIPDVGISLDIIPASYSATAGGWAIDDQNAYIATSSVTPIIYGHNRPAVFAGIRDVNTATTMVIYRADGTASRYSYVMTRFVAPDDASILTESNPEMIILLTCEGFFDELRRLVYFKEQS